MKMYNRFFVAMCLLLACNFASYSQNTHVLTVSANKPKGEVQPTMWGIFFEDINFGADGGIYAEMIKNRSFEFTKPLMGWKQIKESGAKADVQIINRGEKLANPRYAQIKVEAGQGFFILQNEGFRGMGIKAGNGYNFSVQAKASGNLTLKIELVDSLGKSLGETTVAGLSSNWAKLTATVKAATTVPNGKFNLKIEGTGTLDVDMISLFPQDTWKNRPNGLRADAVQLLADMKPGFIRFPGGCIVEGMVLENRYQWKKTIGPVEERETMINRWNIEFPYRSTPDYFQSFGLGFFEYFQLCEDLGAEPLPIINCGMACQFNSAEHVANSQLDPYIQDMLDLIEFANGDITSKWGKVRNELGHPAPFNLKMMGVGNEQWGEQYVEKLKIISKELKAKYPAVKLICSAGPDPDGDKFNYLNKELRDLKVDYIDEHYYRSPEWFLKNASRYDNYDRQGPKIFAGEYAAHSKSINGMRPNNWEAAIAEAALMTGLERNADVVHLASYAPLFAHINAWQWTPDLIWMDNLRVMPTPNYFVQKLFANNKGTHTVPVTENGAVLSGKDNLYVSSVIDKKNNQVIVKLVNTANSASSIKLNIDGIGSLGKVANLILMKSNPADVNTLDKPNQVSPVEKSMKISGKSLHLSLEPQSFVVVKLENVKFK
jgi:alpha-L-arabinofuranosidase